MELTKEELSEIQKLEESLWTAGTRFDKKHMDNILAPGFFEFGRSGRIYKREDVLSVAPQEIKAKLPLKEFQARYICENVVLVTYVSEVQYNTLQVGNRSSLWLKTLTGWQLQFHQGTPVGK